MALYKYHLYDENSALRPYGQAEPSKTLCGRDSFGSMVGSKFIPDSKSTRCKKCWAISLKLQPAQESGAK